VAGYLRVSGHAGFFCFVFVQRNSVLQYETEVKNGKLLLVAHGTADEVERARDLLHQTGAKATKVHAEPVAVGA